MTNFDNKKNDKKLSYAYKSNNNLITIIKILLLFVIPSNIK